MKESRLFNFGEDNCFEHSKNLVALDKDMCSKEKEWVNTFSIHVNKARHQYYQQQSFLIAILLLMVGLGSAMRSTDVLDTDAGSVKVALFNIRHFGNGKMSQPAVVKNILRILDRYDLVFVMETRDFEKTSLVNLRRHLGDDEWDYVTSEPVGRKSYKERYVYFYRPSVVTLMGTHLYDDVKDDFEREPFMAEFKYKSRFAGSVVNVTFLGAHLTPDDVAHEMESLPDVISSARKRFSNSEAYLIMGDFNADCSYLNCGERDTMTLLNTPELYTSLVPNKADTTVSPNTDCAYDRVIVTVHDRPKVKVANVKVYDFQADMGLTYDEAWAVSDHFPVEFTLE